MSGRKQEREPAGDLEFMGMFTSMAGQTVSHYEMGGRIGEGAMGQVYKAFDKTLNRPVAIKVLPHWARGDRAARARFLHEARAASALNHPNIVTVYEIFDHQGVDLMVMEYIDGATLATSIPALGLSIERALNPMIEIAEALYSAHRVGILHRDLKPTNVMLTEGGRAKLLDFGLAVREQRAISAAKLGVQGGTRINMAPEQLAGYPGDVRSEVFSLGLLFFQMLGGCHAFPGDTSREIIQSMRDQPAGRLPPKVPKDLAAIVDICLEVQPDNRYESVEGVLNALATFRDSAKRRYRSAASPCILAPVRRQQVVNLRALAARITTRNMVASRVALNQMIALIKAEATAEIRVEAVSLLKPLLLAQEFFGGQAIPPSVREVRKLLLAVFRLAANDEIATHFNEKELEFLDLYEMDFRGCALETISFNRCFLVGANLRGSRLKGASLVGACVRNVTFQCADLRGADFTDSDWFNALHLTQDQLASVRRGTLLKCPANISGFRQHLQMRYVYPFESWPQCVRQQLLGTWHEYLRPQGLRDFVCAQTS